MKHHIYFINYLSLAIPTTAGSTHSLREVRFEQQEIIVHTLLLMHEALQEEWMGT